MSLTIEGLRAIVFDVDNSLISCDSSDELILAILRRYNADGTDEQLMTMIGDANSDWMIMERALPAESRLAAYAEVMATNLELARQSDCAVELRAVLRDLARRYPLFIVSGRDTGSIRAAMHAHGLSDVFVDVVGADPGDREKPDPATLVAVLQKHGIKPAAAVYVGDKLVDVQLAEAAGTQFVCAAWYEDLLPDAPIKARSISEFASLFE